MNTCLHCSVCEIILLYTQLCSLQQNIFRLSLGFLLTRQELEATVLQKCATVSGLICIKQLRGGRETVPLDTAIANLQPELVSPSMACSYIKAAGLSVLHGGQLHEHKLQRLTGS